MKSKYLTALLLGIIIGFVLGTWFYSKVLDKPETVINQDIKNKKNKQVVTSDTTKFQGKTKKEIRKIKRQEKEASKGG